MGGLWEICQLEMAGGSKRKRRCCDISCILQITSSQLALLASKDAIKMHSGINNIDAIQRDERAVLRCSSGGQIVWKPRDQALETLSSFFYLLCLFLSVMLTIRNGHSDLMCNSIQMLDCVLSSRVSVSDVRWSRKMLIKADQSQLGNDQPLFWTLMFWTYDGMRRPKSFHDNTKTNITQWRQVTRSRRRC